MKAFLLLFLIVFSIPALSDSEINTAKSNLKKWGMAFCLKGYGDGSINKDAGNARNAYFQLGQHVDDAAYEAVKKYFHRAVSQDQTIGKETGKTNLLMTCLNAYEDSEYDKVIDLQDKYISSE